MYSLRSDHVPSCHTSEQTTVPAAMVSVEERQTINQYISNTAGGGKCHKDR